MRDGDRDGVRQGGERLGSMLAEPEQAQLVRELFRQGCGSS
jgi:hypothetical protein